jgi:hypothetical protein
MNFDGLKGKIVVLVLASLIVLVSVDRAVGNEVSVEEIAAPAAVAAVHGPNADYLASEQKKNVQTFETVQGELLNACKSRGYGEECARTLLGMLWKESLNNAHAVGDGGRARGYFQIHYRLHHISVDCAEDLSCSANWTLDYMEQNGYPEQVARAVQCHNGCGVPNGYWQSALRWGERKWNTPLFLEQQPNAVAMR